jgi:hypothetical protein
LGVGFDTKNASPEAAVRIESIRIKGLAKSAALARHLQ